MGVFQDCDVGICVCVPLGTCNLFFVSVFESGETQTHSHPHTDIEKETNASFSERSGMDVVGLNCFYDNHRPFPPHGGCMCMCTSVPKYLLCTLLWFE